MIPRYWGSLLWLFLKDSQLFFWIYLGFSDVHVGWFSIHCLNGNGRVNRAPLCEDRDHPLVSTFHNGNNFIQWCFNSGPVWKTVTQHCTNIGWLLWALVIFQTLHLTIKIAVVIPANTKRRSNVVLMSCQRHIQWYNIQPTEKQVIVLIGDPLSLFPFDKQI